MSEFNLEELLILKDLVTNQIDYLGKTIHEPNLRLDATKGLKRIRVKLEDNVNEGFGEL